VSQLPALRQLQLLLLAVASHQVEARKGVVVVLLQPAWLEVVPVEVASRQLVLQVAVAQPSE
jgi:hypothetical protein